MPAIAVLERHLDADMSLAKSWKPQENPGRHIDRELLALRRSTKCRCQRDVIHPPESCKVLLENRQNSERQTPGSANSTAVRGQDIIAQGSLLVGDQTRLTNGWEAARPSLSPHGEGGSKLCCHEVSNFRSPRTGMVSKIWGSQGSERPVCPSCPGSWSHRNDFPRLAQGSPATGHKVVQDAAG